MKKRGYTARRWLPSRLCDARHRLAAKPSGRGEHAATESAHCEDHRGVSLPSTTRRVSLRSTASSSSLQHRASYSHVLPRHSRRVTLRLHPDGLHSRSLSLFLLLFLAPSFSFSLSLAKLAWVFLGSSKRERERERASPVGCAAARIVELIHATVFQFVLGHFSFFFLICRI